MADPGLTGPARPGAASFSVRMRGPDGPVQVRSWPAASPTGPVLLALHGWTDSGEVFAPLAASRRRRWTVVAPDAPAHGGTPLRAGRYRIADQAVAGTAVLDSLRLARLSGHPARGRPTAVVLGHSMGALTAARLAAVRPDLVRGLVLEEPARSTARRTESTERMRAWLAALRAGDHAARVAWARANHPEWPAAELGPWARSKAAVDLEHLDREIDWGESLPVLLSEVHCPVLIVRGDPARGGIVSASGARRCAAACPGGAQVLALAAGHSPRREATTVFTAAVREVLSRW